MKMKIEMTDDSVDALIVAQLQQQLKNVKEDIKTHKNTSYGDINNDDWQKLKKGLKEVINYYGG